jgi:antitoxin Phd
MNKERKEGIPNPAAGSTPLPAVTRLPLAGSVAVPAASYVEGRDDIATPGATGGMNVDLVASGPRRAGGSGRDVLTMTSTEAQNGFGRLLEAVARDRTVLIRKHNVTQAVVMSVDRYVALTRAESPMLETLTAEFDELLARMQTPESRAAMREAFAASPEELGRAVLDAYNSPVQ